MKIELDLVAWKIDDDRIPEKVAKELSDAKINIFTDKDYFEVEDSCRAFSLWLEYQDGNRLLGYEVNLDDLELFAATLSKMIYMFRRDMADVIKEKTEKGLPI